MNFLYTICALVAGAVLGMLAFGFIFEMIHAENKSGLMILKVLAGTVLLCAGALVCCFIPGLALAGYLIGLLMALAPYIKTQDDLHPESRGSAKE